MTTVNKCIWSKSIFIILKIFINIIWMKSKNTIKKINTHWIDLKYSNFDHKYWSCFFANSHDLLRNQFDYFCNLCIDACLRKSFAQYCFSVFIFLFLTFQRSFIFFTSLTFLLNLFSSMRIIIDSLTLFKELKYLWNDENVVFLSLIEINCYELIRRSHVHWFWRQTSLYIMIVRSIFFLIQLSYIILLLYNQLLDNVHRIILFANFHSNMKFSSTIELQNFVLNFIQNN